MQTMIDFSRNGAVDPNHRLETDREKHPSLILSVPSNLEEKSACIQHLAYFPPTNRRASASILSALGTIASTSGPL